jgi:hypothetical protein
LEDYNNNDTLLPSTYKLDPFLISADMPFNKINNNISNEFKWKFEYEDTVYKVYDKNNYLAGYFFPNYNLVEQIGETSANSRSQEGEGEKDEIIQEMNKRHESVRGGSLMIPMLRLNLLDNESGKEGMNLDYTISELQENLQRAKQWKQWLQLNTPEFGIVGNAVYTAREDRNMLSLVLGIDSRIILGEKEIGQSLIPVLDKLHKDGML